MYQPQENRHVLIIIRHWDIQTMKAIKLEIVSGPSGLESI